MSSDTVYTDLMQEHLDEVVNKTWNKWGRAKHKKDEIINCVLGLGAESGEVLDLFKKGFYHKELDEAGQKAWMELLVSELGDVAYYWIKLLDLFDLSVEEVLEGNKAKLFKRHGNPEFTGQAVETQND